MAIVDISKLPKTIELRTLIIAQLPRALQTKLSLMRVETDAYHLGARIVFTDGKNRWDTRLETTNIDGVQVACVIPDWFISHLCASA